MATKKSRDFRSHLSEYGLSTHIGQCSSTSFESFLTNVWSPNEEFSMAEQRVAYEFLNEFSNSGSPKRVLNPLKSTSKTHTQRFVQSSKIFVCGAYHSFVNATLVTVGPIGHLSPLVGRRSVVDLSPWSEISHGSVATEWTLSGGICQGLCGSASSSDVHCHAGNNISEK